MRTLLGLLVALLAVSALLWWRGSPASLPSPEAPLGPAAGADTATTGSTPAATEAAPPRAAVAVEPLPLGDGAAPGASATVVAEVVDSQGVGVFKASVVLLQPRDEGTNRLESADTDPEGFAQLVVPSGQPLTLSAGRFGETSNVEVEVSPLAAGEVRPLVIVVTHRSSTTAEVLVRVQTEGGAPIAGAALHVSRSGGFTAGGPPRVITPDMAADTVTDPLGEARVTTEAFGITTAVVRASGFAPQLAMLRGSEATTAPLPEVVVTLTPAARAEGRAQGAPPGARARANMPGYGLRPRVSAAEFWVGSDFTFEVAVRPDGTFELADLPTGAPLRFELVHERHLLVVEPDAVTLGAGEVRELDWRVGAGAVARCVVREATGMPVAGIDVWLLSSDEGAPGLSESYWKPAQRRRTDAEGSVTFDPVVAGAWIVALAPPERDASASDAYAPVAMRVELREDTPITTTELTLTRGRFIRGTTVAPTGAPVRAHVLAMGPNGIFLSESADAQGAFALGPLVAGSYNLTARIFAARAGEPSLGPSAPVDVDVKIEIATEPVELRLTPGASLSVTASLNGTPVAAQFTATSTSLISAQGYGGKGALERRFVGLGLGPIVVTATTQDGLVGILAPYDLTAPGEHTVDVPVAPSGRVRIQNAGPHPNLSCVAAVSGIDIFAGDALAGGEEVFHLPSGPARLRVSAFDRSSTVVPPPRIFDETHEVLVVAGEEVVIRVPQ